MAFDVVCVDSPQYYNIIICKKVDKLVCKKFSIRVGTLSRLIKKYYTLIIRTLVHVPISMTPLITT